MGGSLSEVGDGSDQGSVFPSSRLPPSSLLKFSALTEADKDDDVGLPFHHKTFLVLPATAPLYLSTQRRGVRKSFIL